MEEVGAETSDGGLEAVEILKFKFPLGTVHGGANS